MRVFSRIYESECNNEIDVFPWRSKEALSWRYNLKESSRRRKFRVWGEKYVFYAVLDNISWLDGFDLLNISQSFWLAITFDWVKLPKWIGNLMHNILLCHYG